MMKAVGIAALGLAAWAALAPQEASAHGRRHYDNPPIIVVPPGHRAQPYPYWYYSRPQPRHAPPVIVMPAPRRHYYERPHHRPHYGHYGRHRPGMTFHFRF
jgi:hypothetical protein